MGSSKWQSYQLRASISAGQRIQANTADQQSASHRHIVRHGRGTQIHTVRADKYIKLSMESNLAPGQSHLPRGYWVY